MAVIAFGIERSLGWHSQAAVTLSHAKQYIGLSLWLIVFVGLWDFIINLIPFTAANIGSDGMQILQLLFKTGQWRTTEAYDRFLAMQWSTLPPSDWDPDLINWLIEHHNNENVRTYARIANYLLIRENASPKAAEPYLERCLTQVPKDTNLAAKVYLSAAFHYAAYDKDLAKAQAWLDLAGETPDQEEVQAVILHLEGDTEQALVLLDEAIEKENLKLGTRFDVGTVRLTQAWLLRFREQITGKSATGMSAEETLLPQIEKLSISKLRLALLGTLSAILLLGVLLVPRLSGPPAALTQEVSCPEKAPKNWDKVSVAACYSVSFPDNKRFRAWTKAETKILDLEFWETRENAVVYKVKDSEQVHAYYYDFENELVYLLNLERQLER